MTERLDKDVPASEALAAPLWFSAEYDTLLWAVDECARSGRDRSAWRLALALQDFFELRGGLGDWERIGQLGLVAARRDRNGHAVALAQRSLGIIHLYQGNFEQAVPELQQALTEGRRHGGAKTTAVTLRSLGEALSENGELPSALDCFQQAMARFQQLDLPDWAAWTQWSLGVAQRVHREPNRPCAHCATAWHGLRASATLVGWR